jgi:hypothetical protein
MGEITQKEEEKREAEVMPLGDLHIEHRSPPMLLE